MKTEFYKKLYADIMAEADEGGWDVDDSNLELSFEFEYDDYYVECECVFGLEFEDESFSHAFGVCERESYHISHLIDMTVKALYDEEGNDITDQFDYKEFNKVAYGR